MSHLCGLKSCLNCSTKLLSASSDSDSSKTNNIGLNVGPSNCNLQPPLALWTLPSSAWESVMSQYQKVVTVVGLKTL